MNIQNRYRWETEIIKKYARKYDYILDIGCGSGEIANELIKSPYIVMGFDKMKKPKNCRFIYTKKLPKERKFDIIFSTGFASYGSNPEMLKEEHKMLKKNGYLIIDYHRHYNLYALYKLLILRFLIKYLEKSESITMGKCYHWGIIGIKSEVEKAGFKIKKIETGYTYPLFLKTKRQQEWFEKKVGKNLRFFLARSIIIVCKKKEVKTK